MNHTIIIGVIVVVCLLGLFIFLLSRSKKHQPVTKDVQNLATFNWDKESVVIPHREAVNIIPKENIGDIHFFNLDAGEHGKDIMAVVFFDHNDKLIDGTIGEWDIDEIIMKFTQCKYPIEVKPLPIKLYIYDQVVAALDHRKRDLLLAYWEDYKVCQGNKTHRDFAAIDSDFHLILNKGFIALPHMNRLEIGEIAYRKSV